MQSGNYLAFVHPSWPSTSLYLASIRTIMVPSSSSHTPDVIELSYLLLWMISSKLCRLSAWLRSHPASYDLVPLVPIYLNRCFSEVHWTIFIFIFIYFYFFKSYAFDWLRYKESMQLIAMANKKLVPPHPRKHPNPRVCLVWEQPHISPIAQPNSTNIHVHTKEVERNKTSRKEGNRAPYREVNSKVATAQNPQSSR